MSNQRFVSPNEMQDQAIRYMLGGKKPKMHGDWIKCAQFWAVNTPAETSLAICRIMKMLFKAPLADWELEAIVGFYHTLGRKV